MEFRFCFMKSVGKVRGRSQGERSRPLANERRVAAEQVAGEQEEPGVCTPGSSGRTLVSA
ncbi:hypothetical protein ARTHRO9AX_220359 [Arthrobacter sp. 9AX]|nr:hypothetical protein ARTHRO9AX_220359 [Arthrobacter sp. 9AX]